TSKKVSRIVRDPLKALDTPTDTSVRICLSRQDERIDSTRPSTIASEASTISFRPTRLTVVARAGTVKRSKRARIGKTLTHGSFRPHRPRVTLTRGDMTATYTINPLMRQWDYPGAARQFLDPPRGP